MNHRLRSYKVAFHTIHRSLHYTLHMMPEFHTPKKQRRGLLTFLITIGLFFASVNLSVAQKAEITVAAAADLRYAMDSLVSVFKTEQPGVRVTVIYGSSGKFFQQISHNAPFDVFFSADIDFPKQLEKKGLTASPIHTYAVGRLVLWSTKIKPKDLKSLQDRSVRKIAIANPQLAPYGKRAEEVLRHYKLYDQVKNKLVQGENIAQTAQFVSTGAADIGLIALSLALSPPLKSQGAFYLIPSTAHTPLQQAHVVLKRALHNKSAFAFLTFMETNKAKKIMEAFGFSIPK